MARLLICFLVFFFLFFHSSTEAQTITSSQDGAWNVTTTWVGGIIPTSANSTSIIINHNVTIPAGFSVTIDQTTISAGKTLTVTNTGILDINSSVSPALFVSGTLIANAGSSITGTSLANAANVTFASGATYRHELTIGFAVPFATWDANSTLQITGFTGGASISSTSWSQSFGHIEFNCASLAGTANFAGFLTTVKGNFRVISSGAAGSAIQLSSGASKTITIGGNLSVEGASRILFTTDGSCTANITGSLSIVSTNVNLSQVAGQLVTGGTCTLNVGSDFTLNIPSAASFRFSNGSNAGNGILNLKGNFNFVSGIIDETSTSGKGIINIVGSGIQSFTRAASGTTLATTSTIDFSVAASSALNLNTSIMGGGGALSVSGGIKVGALDAAGAIQGGTLAGNIRVAGTRFFDLGSKVEYNGAGPQFMGSAHPNGSTITTTINNSSGVSLFSNVTIGGNLVLQSGNLNVTAGKVLTLGGSITPNSNFITVTPTSDLILNGSSISGTFPFPAGNQTFSNFTLNRSSGGVTFANNVTISNSVLLTAGALDFSGRTLTLNGTFNAVSGTLSSTSASILTIGGSGNFGTLFFTPALNTLGTLNINRTSSGSVTLNSNLTISGNLNLSQGDFYNALGLTMGNNSVINRNVLSQLLSNRPSVNAGEKYSVSYTGSNAIDTGLELPDPASVNNLNDLTINGGPISLQQDVTVNGNVNFTSGSFDAVASSITMRGASWVDDAGDFIPDTGWVIFGGNTTVSGSSTPQLGNIQIKSTGSLTLPSGAVNVAGDFDFLSGSSFSANGSTVILNGSTTQTISANGAVFSNITVNKTGATDVTLTSSLHLSGTLDIQSGSTVASNGFLRLLSTSDGIIGNASIAALLSGADVSGDVQVQRFMSGEGRIWRYISSPVTNVAVDSLMDDFPVTGTFSDPSSGPGLISGNPSFYYYDETLSGGLQSGYKAYPASGPASSSPLVPALGYSAFIRKANSSTTWDVTGPINKGLIDFNVTFTNTGTPAADGWNLVGNPYPSSISWNNAPGWDTLHISPSIAVRDNGGGGGGFLYWDGAIGSFNGGTISTGQGFWIRTTGAGAHLRINENAKVQTGAVFYRERSEELDYFSLTVSHGTYSDIAFVRLRPESKITFDQFDAPKLSNDNIGLSTRTDDDEIVAINALNEFPCNGPVKLDLALTKDANGKILSKLTGSYKITLGEFGKFTQGIFHLHDRFTNTTTDLNEVTAYQFQVTSSPGSFANDRFELTFEDGDMALDEKINYSDSVCEASPVSLTLPKSINDYKYYVTWNGNKVSESVAGIGNEITLYIEKDTLEVGANELVVQVQGFCKTEPLTEMATVTVMESPRFTVSSSKACNSSESTFVINGAPNGTLFRWYKTSDDQQVLEESYGSQFIAKELKGSKTFFVAGVSPYDCISQRVSVIAEVVNYNEVTIHENAQGYLESSYESGNQWYFNSDSIKGATQKIISADKSGIYKVVVAIDGCTSTSEYVKIVTAIEEVNETINIYPNVVHNELHIEASFLVQNEVVIGVYDLLGRLVGRKEVPKGLSGFLINFDFKEFNSGLYIVKIINGQRTYEAKVVKE